jgi:AbiV family abortive infection protein
MTNKEASAPSDILANAERLISDAKFLHENGRSRSAATLIVIALEQLGSYVEALTRETYPDAILYMGIFGKNANAHARRQDALVSHVMNYAFGHFLTTILSRRFVLERSADEDPLDWLIRTTPHRISDEEKKQRRECPNIAAAQLLMHLVRTNQLKELREYGQYENTENQFCEAAIMQVLDLAARVREMLADSWVVPEAFGLRGVNIPEGQRIKLKSAAP